MKTSVEWLREYTDVNVDVKTLADRLTMTGSKVETNFFSWVTYTVFL